jgi:hypothetical protein
MSEHFRIGTAIHVLSVRGCDFGFLTAWDDGSETGSIIGLSPIADGSFTSMFPHGDGITHDAACEPLPGEDEKVCTFHLVEECRWHR